MATIPEIITAFGKTTLQLVAQADSLEELEHIRRCWRRICRDLERALWS